MSGGPGPGWREGAVRDLFKEGKGEEITSLGRRLKTEFPEHTCICIPSLSLNPSTHGELTTSGTHHFLRKPRALLLSPDCGKSLPHSWGGR